VATNTLHDASTRLKIVRNNFHGNVLAAPLHRRACMGISAFVCGGCGLHYTGVLGASAYAGVYIIQVFFDISVQIWSGRDTWTPTVWARRNLGIDVFAYVYKAHICICMLGGGIRSWTRCFFSLTFFSFESKRCERNTDISNP